MIVVGHDGRAQADDALALGVLIAGATGERLVLVGAYGPEGWIGEEALDARRREILEELQVVAARSAMFSSEAPPTPCSRARPARWW
jgi:nucleotide-binding universal stress UspA family protein